MTKEEKLEEAKRLYKTANADQKYVLESLFPELKESDDEKIRKHLISLFEKFVTFGVANECETSEIKVDDILYWLKKQGEQSKKNDVCNNCDQQGSCVSPCPMKLVEKQGEQEPAWSEEDRDIRDNIIRDLKRLSGDMVSPNQSYQKEIQWLKSLRPQNWTKEDKERYISCLQKLSTGNPEQSETINSKWFKDHVYSQPSWKPSKKQMVALEHFIVYHNGSTNYAKDLEELRLQLKKLREE